MPDLATLRPPAALESPTVTVREELQEQLAAEKEERSGKSRKALSRANLPVSANATANGLSTAHTPNGGAQGALPGLAFFGCLYASRPLTPCPST